MIFSIQLYIGPHWKSSTKTRSTIHFTSTAGSFQNHQPTHTFLQFKMLTRVDLIVFNCIYVTYSKFFTATPFTWKNGRMTMETNRAYNYTTWVLFLLALAYKYKQLFTLIETRDFNGLVIHGVFVVALSANIVLKLNIWLYNTELTRLITVVMRINSSWG